MFGTNLIILGPNPLTGISSDYLKKARLYADKYMLDVFLHICKDDYVQRDDTVSRGKLVHEICKSITKLREEYNERGSGHKTDTPDELYAKYISIISGLPDDASVWSINLCSTYFSALTTNLKEKMEEFSFCIPPLNNMGTKALQIEELRTVRTSAVTSFRALDEEEKRIRCLFPQLQSRRPPRDDEHQYNVYPVNNQVGRDICFNSESQAETTLAWCGGRDTSNRNPDTSTCSGLYGNQYHYNPDDPLYLRKFPVGWKVCYKCGREDHWKRELCPEGNNNDPQMTETFHKELKCHKPAFRRSTYAPRVSYIQHMIYGQ